ARAAGLRAAALRRRATCGGPGDRRPRARGVLGRGAVAAARSHRARGARTRGGAVPRRLRRDERIQSRPRRDRRARMSQPRERRFVAVLQELSIPLLAGVAAALLAANVAPGAYQRTVHWRPFGDTALFGHPLDLDFLVSDVFMALFFAIAAVEITRSC